MKIEEGNATKKSRINERFSISIILTSTIFMISGSTATMSHAAPQTLPSCTDPTGQNLPCMMVISTLPPPPNALRCQETSGQLLPCSYATQNLSNGEQIVAITVYVPISYVFTGYGPWTIVKQVVHETKTRIVHVPECPKGQALDPKTHKCVDITYCPPPKGYHIDSITHKCVPDNCQPGQVYNPITGKCETQKPCERLDSAAKTDPDKDLKTKDCDLGDANEHVKTSPILSCNSPNYNGTCLPTKNMTVPASGGKGTGPSCINNCTTGTPPAVDCKTNPNDPSCPPAPQLATPPSTKTCPDGSVIDASASCPTSTNSNPTPPSNNNPPPSGSENGNNNPSGGSGNNNNGGGSSSGGGGSSPTNP